MAKKNILFAAFEASPFIKTGGLGDVSGALPVHLKNDKYDARVILPLISSIPEEYKNRMKFVTSYEVPLGWRNQYCGLFTLMKGGVKYYFLDNEYYFKRSQVYGEFDDAERVAFFSKAVLETVRYIEKNYRPDIIHCNDWHTALIPVYLRELYKGDPLFDPIRTVFTIHNLKFQGIYDIKTFRYLTAFPEYVFTPANMEFNYDANMLKAGIVFSDYVTTVSDTYAGEIQMPYYGEGLDGLMRHKNHSLCGIVNGIDYNVYAPEHDIQIYDHYTPETFDKKVNNKRGLQAELGLPEDDNKFMIAMITRLTDQKGLDLVNYVIERIVDEHTQLVVLGTGDEKYENLFRHYQWKYPERVSANIYYSDNRAHKLYAASDAMLMPSRFEPCGLTQLIALRYGSVPIVRETGGLKDTVQPYNWFENTGTGFSFANYNAEEMLNSINYAKTVYFTDRERWKEIAIRGMRMDYSWNNSARRYEELYYRLTPWY